MYCKTCMEEYVEQLYMQMGFSAPGDMSIERVSQQLGIAVIHSSFTSRAMFYGGKPMINLNRTLSPSEELETFSHELFHILKETGNQVNTPVMLREMRESKANNFALHFCIPTFMLAGINWPERNSNNYIAELFHVTVPFAEKRLMLYECRLFQGELDHFNALISTY